jgi:hypothetical protein
MADFKSGSGPTIKGLSKTESPSDGKTMMTDMLSKLAGKMPTPRMSSGDKVAQAIQLLREAAQEDLRIAPLVNGAIQTLVTGGGPGGGPGQSPAPVQGPVSQSAGAAPGAMSAIAQMMGAGSAM